MEDTGDCIGFFQKIACRSKHEEGLCEFIVTPYYRLLLFYPGILFPIDTSVQELPLRRQDEINSHSVKENGGPIANR